MLLIDTYLYDYSKRLVGSHLGRGLDSWFISSVQYQKARQISTTACSRTIPASQCCVARIKKACVARLHTLGTAVPDRDRRASFPAKLQIAASSERRASRNSHSSVLITGRILRPLRVPIAWFSARPTYNSKLAAVVERLAGACHLTQSVHMQHENGKIHVVIWGE